VRGQRIADLRGQTGNHVDRARRQLLGEHPDRPGTVTSASAMQAISGGLGVNGTLMVIGAVGALTVNSLDLLARRASVKGWYSGTAVDERGFPARASTSGV
jgi:hypothetical protein